jgi:excisionase family DNA binding protein
MHAETDRSLTTATEKVPAAVRSAEFLTVTEAAALLNVCERTIYDALRTRRLRGRRIGRLWRTKREWLEEFGTANRP